MHEMPGVEGKNHFRIFIKGKPIHTFYMYKRRASMKYTFTFEIRNSNEKVKLYFGWDPVFYHDDAVRSNEGHQMYSYEKNELLGRLGL